MRAPSFAHRGQNVKAPGPYAALEGELRAHGLYAVAIAARKQCANSGQWVPDGKRPIGGSWQTPTPVTPSTFESSNVGGIGLVLGVTLRPDVLPIVDVDCDCPEAIAAARRFAFATSAVFGHAGAPSSHFLYRCPDPQGIVQLADPDREERKRELRANGDRELAKAIKAGIVELRGGGPTGAQSVLPPSPHAQHGPRSWTGGGGLERLYAASERPWALLLRLVRYIGAHVLLTRAGIVHPRVGAAFLQRKARTRARFWGCSDEKLAAATPAPWPWIESKISPARLDRVMTWLGMEVRRPAPAVRPVAPRRSGGRQTPGMNEAIRRIKFGVDLIDYLDARGVKRGPRINDGACFHSPLREDRNPSFNVFLGHRGWTFKDMSTGETGSILDLHMAFAGASFAEAVRALDPLGR